MAIVMKTNSEKPMPVRAAKPKLELALATKVNVPPEGIAGYSICIFGSKKIGKTSLAAEFPNPYFLATEPGTKALRVKSSFIPDWDHFVGYVDLLVKEADPTRTTVVDIVDLVYDMIYDKTCKEQGIESPTEEKDFGATWRKIRKAFRDQIQRIISLPGGSLFLSHDTEKEVKLKDGTKTDRVQPTMSKAPLGEVEGIVDVIAFYGYEGEDRFLWIKGHSELMAGSRLVERFKVDNSKKVDFRTDVTRIPMGSTAKQAYQNVLKAFKNEQETADGIVPEVAKKTTTLKIR